MSIRTRKSPDLPRFAAEGGRPTIYPRSLVEVAYEQLLSMLVTMQIQPGTPIRIEALSKDLQISQTPVREALTLLEARKLVYKTPNVGFRAADLLTRSEVYHLFELRMLLEPKAAAFAARRGDERSLADIREAFAQINEAHDPSSERSYARFAEGDARLHLLIAFASGNRFIAEAIEGLHVHHHTFRFLYNTNATQHGTVEHAVIVEAILARDARYAERAMRNHIKASLDRMKSALDLADDRRSSGKSAGPATAGK